MDLITLVVALIIVGVLLWAVNTLIPMDPKIRQILNVVVVIGVLLWLLYAFVGGAPYSSQVKVGAPNVGPGSRYMAGG